ncbi:RND family efflux transporter MFP subunit [Pseudoduganella flava]|nr:efflux RND transporter periplasmic adaptor subunit [Pseudoduganella flava]TWI45803.1 RND family efflux transporter MFP subunit [Pseudoduganella flava]
MSDISAQLHLLKIGRPAPETAPAPRRAWLPAALCGGAVLCAAAAVFTLDLTLGRGTPAATPAPVPAQAAAPAAAPTAADTAADTAAPARLIASGYVVARRRATVAAEVTGRLLDILVEEGQQVRAGQVLAVLNAGMADSELAGASARVASADAGVLAAQADLAEVRDTAARNATLARTGFISPASVAHDNTRVASLEAQLVRARHEAAAARADAVRLQAQRRQYDIRAPFAGIVVDKNAQPGEIVSPISGAGGFTRSGICTIVDMESLEIQAEVNETFIGRVHAGQTVDAVLDAYPGMKIAARVLAVVPTANRDKGTVRVRIALLEANPKILPDMAVKVTIHNT